jgi:hypothetical protein
MELDHENGPLADLGNGVPFILYQEATKDGL